MVVATRPRSHHYQPTLFIDRLASCFSHCSTNRRLLTALLFIPFDTYNNSGFNGSLSHLLRSVYGSQESPEDDRGEEVSIHFNDGNPLLHLLTYGTAITISENARD